jgi:hypothetical protein
MGTRPRLIRCRSLTSLFVWSVIFSKAPCIQFDAIRSGTVANQLQFEANFIQDIISRGKEATLLVHLLPHFLKGFPLPHVQRFNLQLEAIPVFRHGGFGV